MKYKLYSLNVNYLKIFFKNCVLPVQKNLNIWFAIIYIYIWNSNFNVHRYLLEQKIHTCKIYNPDFI